VLQKKTPIPLKLGKGLILTLQLSGTNTLKGGYAVAGIYVPEGATVIITSKARDSETDGVLNAYGGPGGAGIGCNLARSGKSKL
jgi:hypothetical protein